jgi:hypothetical protein
MEYKRLTFFDFENYFLNLSIHSYGNNNNSWYKIKKTKEMPFKIIGLVKTDYKSIRIKFFDDKIYKSYSNKLSPYCAEIKFENGLLISQEIKTLNGSILESLSIEYIEDKPCVLYYKLPKKDVLTTEIKIESEIILRDNLHEKKSLIKFSINSTIHLFNTYGEKVEFHEKENSMSSYASVSGINAFIKKTKEIFPIIEVNEFTGIPEKTGDIDEIDYYNLFYNNDGFIRVAENNNGKSQKYLISNLGSCTSNENFIEFRGPIVLYKDFCYHQFERSYEILSKKEHKIVDEKRDNYLTTNKNLDIIKYTQITSNSVDTNQSVSITNEWVFDKDNFPIYINNYKNDETDFVPEIDSSIFVMESNLSYYFKKIRQNWFHEYLTKIILSDTNNNFPFNKDTEVEFDMFYRIIYVLNLKCSSGISSLNTCKLKTFQYKNQYFDIFENELCHHEKQTKDMNNIENISLSYGNAYCLENDYYFESDKLTCRSGFKYNEFNGEVDFLNDKGIIEKIEWSSPVTDYETNHMINKDKTEISIISLQFIGRFPLDFLSFSFLKIEQLNFETNKYSGLNQEEKTKYRKYKITDWTGKELRLTKVRKVINENIFEIITLLDDVVKNISIMELE